MLALTLGALTGFQLLHVTPSATPIFELPLALIVTAGVPLLLILHITSMSTLAKTPGLRCQPPAHCWPARHRVLP